MRKLIALLIIHYGFQLFGMHDPGLPELVLDTGSQRASGITSQFIETNQYVVEDSALEMAPGDICFAKVVEPAESVNTFAVWANTPAHPCRSKKLPQHKAVILTLGAILSKTGKVMGPEGGKVEHFYQARLAETERVVGKIHLSTDYRNGVTRQYGLNSLCGDEGGCRLVLTRPGNTLSVEN